MVNRGKIKKSAKTVVTDNRFDVSIFAKNLVFTGQHDEPNYNLFNFPDAAKSKKTLRLIYHGKDYPKTK